MPVAKHTIVFARIVPSELNIVTTENNNVIDLALCKQLRKATTGQDIWQNSANYDQSMGWNSFVEHFYGGGEGDFGVSQVAGRLLTMIGVSGEYANGVPQSSSALTHIADRGRTDSNGTKCKISGVSVLNDVIDSVVYDLGLPHDSWDSCSYMNVVNQLQDVHTLLDCTRIQGKLQQSCALSMASLAHEIASNYDESMGFTADLDNKDSSAVYNLYQNGLDNAIEIAMGGCIQVVQSIDSGSVVTLGPAGLQSVLRVTIADPAAGGIQHLGAQVAEGSAVLGVNKTTGNLTAFIGKLSGHIEAAQTLITGNNPSYLYITPDPGSGAFSTGDDLRIVGAGFADSSNNALTGAANVANKALAVTDIPEEFITAVLAVAEGAHGNAGTAITATNLDLAFQVAANHGLMPNDRFKLSWLGSDAAATSLDVNKILTSDKTAITNLVVTVDRFQPDIATAAAAMTEANKNTAGFVTFKKHSDGTVLKVDRRNGGTAVLLHPAAAAGLKLGRIHDVVGNDNTQFGTGLTDANQLHTLVLSVMFKNSTPGVRNVEFRLHFKVGMAHGSRTLEDLCRESADAKAYELDGTQV